MYATSERFFALVYKHNDTEGVRRIIIATIIVEDELLSISNINLTGYLDVSTCIILVRHFIMHICTVLLYY